MKKFFFSIMLAAAVATGLMSCNKTTSLSDTHTQKYTLGETSYDINNAFAIENIKDSIGQIYNVIMLSQRRWVSLATKPKGFSSFLRATSLQAHTTLLMIRNIL